GWAYVRYGGLGWMQAVFYGVGASVIAIITLSAIKLTRKTLGTDRVLWGLYLLAAAATVVTEAENVLLFLVAGLAAYVARCRPARRRPTATAAGLVALPLGGPCPPESCPSKAFSSRLLSSSPRRGPSSSGAV